MAAPSREQLSYQALLSLVRVSGLLRKAGDRFFRDHHLTQSQFNVLMILKHDAPQGLSQTELCRRLLVNPADVTGLVRRLLARGVVRRADHPTDERAWVVRLSDRGKALLARVEPPYYRTVEKVMGVHGERDCRALIALLERTERSIAEAAS